MVRQGKVGFKMVNELEKLNEKQREAVMTTEGVVRVIAGAGSGKTKALTSRFAFLVNEAGILPGNILCVTFTNKAANEMRQRIHALTGDNDTGYINTFHGFCVSVLQEDSHAVQYPKSFLVLDNSDIDAMLGVIYEERGLTLRDMTFSHARDRIEMLKLKERPDYYIDMIEMSVDLLHQKYMEAVDPMDIIFYGYLYQEKKCFGLDYNDLITFTLYIFKQNEQIRKKWQKRLEYIMIDEFQDIDDLQYRLMLVLQDYHKNLFVVGDPDQTIYSWRGANGRYLLNFQDDFPQAQTIMMMQNYRSTPQILSAVNSLIRKNQVRIEKDLIPMLPDGEPVVCSLSDNAEKEAEWIADQITRLHEEGEPYHDMTILYRAHYVTRAVEEVLMKRKIPYTIYSGVQFFGRMEIKDALSYLRMIVYKDDLSFLRTVNTPKRNLGKRRMAFLKEYAEAHRCSLYQALTASLDEPVMKGTRAQDYVHLIEKYHESYEGRPISDLLSSVLDDSGYEEMLRTEGSQERLDNLAELKQSIYDYEISCGEETDLPQYLSHVALFSNADAELAQDKVKLMTVHAAKGLEFPDVFLCGLCEGIFPSRKVTTRPGMEEERRLAFVAMTRAEKRLFLSASSGRNVDGSPRYPSRFILDIDPEYIQFTEKPQESLIRDAKTYIKRKERWMENEQHTMKKGTRVRHSIFHDGTVIGIDEEKHAYIIQFDEISTPRSISFRAHLVKIKAENGES
jgi:DNA helicase-2/ATP-dependent DNA helicase PcrA